MMRFRKKAGHARPSAGENEQPGFYRDDLNRGRLWEKRLLIPLGKPVSNAWARQNFLELRENNLPQWMISRQVLDNSLTRNSLFFRADLQTPAIKNCISPNR
jgi:hypothetical protein